MTIIDLDAIYRVQPDALIREFASLAEWTQFESAFEVYDRRRMGAIADRAIRMGVHSVHMGPIAASEVQMRRLGNHGHLEARSLDSRSRALLDIIAASRFAHDKRNTRIFCGEAFSPMAMQLRASYPKFTGSQYMPDLETQQQMYPILHQDLMGLDLPDSSFDLVITSEVFEHIPDLPLALSEQARVLREGV